MLSKIKKTVKNFQMKIVISTGMKNRCMLHGRVFVMTAVLNRFMNDTFQIYNCDFVHSFASSSNCGCTFELPHLRAK